MRRRGYWLPALPVEKSEEWGRMKTRSACQPDVTTASHKLAYCELKYLDLNDYDLDFSSNGAQRGLFVLLFARSPLRAPLLPNVSYIRMYEV